MLLLSMTTVALTPNVSGERLDASGVLVEGYRYDAYGRQTRKHYPLTAFLPATPATMDAGYEGYLGIEHHTGRNEYAEVAALPRVALTMSRASASTSRSDRSRSRTWMRETPARAARAARSGLNPEGLRYAASGCGSTQTSQVSSTWQASRACGSPD